MTVAAALRIEGVPALIGDFLITDNDKKKPYMFLPTRLDLNSDAFRHLDRRVVAVCRKIHIFNDSFVAGFSGSVRAGGEIFSELEQRFSARAPTVLELNDTFQQFNMKYSGCAFVNGWTTHSRPCCFEWSAGPGSRAAKVAESILGSGATHFRSLIAGADKRGYSESVTQSWDKAVLRGLATIGGLVTEELSTGKNLESAYGFGGEMILQTSAGFRTVSKFTLLFWNVRIELDGTINYSPKNVAAVYENKGRYTVVQITYLTPAATGLAAKETYVWAITPIHDQITDLDVAAIGRLDLSAPYYFVAFFVLDVKSRKSGVLKIVAKNEPGAPVRFFKRNGLDHFETDRDSIEPQIRNMF